VKLQARRIKAQRPSPRAQWLVPSKVTRPAGRAAHSKDARPKWTLAAARLAHKAHVLAAARLPDSRSEHGKERLGLRTPRGPPPSDLVRPAGQLTPPHDPASPSTSTSFTGEPPVYSRTSREHVRTAPIALRAPNHEVAVTPSPNPAASFLTRHPRSPHTT